MPKKMYVKRKRRTPASIMRAAGLALLTGAVVYFLLAGGLGSYIARNFIIPNMQGAQPTLPVATPPPIAGGATPAPSVQAAPSPTPVPEIVSDVFELPPLYFWSVQLGSFANYQNAAAMSGMLRSRGAGGYIYTDAQGYARVLASSYAAREDALSVQSQLLSEQGMESHILEGGTDGVRLMLTAPRTDIDTVKSAYEAWASVMNNLPALSYAMDKGEKTPEEVLAEIAAMADKLGGIVGALPSDHMLQGSGSAAITGLKTLIAETADNLISLGQLDKTASIAISSGIKYSYTDCLYRYTLYVMGISARAE